MLLSIRYIIYILSTHLCYLESVIVTNASHCYMVQMSDVEVRLESESLYPRDNTIVAGKEIKDELESNY